MTQLSYMRQLDIFNPINQRYKIVIFGAGSIGSFVALNLAKLGFENIKVIDYDIIDEYNIPNQFYNISSVGKKKVDALKDIIKDFTNVEIETEDIKVDENYDIPFNLTSIYILTFDTLEARKLVYDKLKDRENYLIDCRMGGEEFIIYTSMMSNKDDLVEHDKLFDITPTELPCGERSIIYNILNVSSEVCNIVKKINNQEKYPKRLNRSMKGYLILNDLK